jgi:GT2 family glycosyltransferase
MENLVSIIIPTRNEGFNLKKTIDSIKENTDYSNYEFVVAYDTKEDIKNIDGYKYVKKIDTNGLGPAISRNVAAKTSNGKILFFVDSHVFSSSSNWLTEMIRFLKHNKNTICTPCVSVHDNLNLKGYGLKLNPDLTVEWLNKKYENPYHVPIACACCMALKRNDFFNIGMFNSSFFKWGSEDTEFSIRAWLLGYEVFVLPHIEVSHVFKEKFSYHMSWKDLDINAFRMAFLHFDARRISLALKNIRQNRNVDEALNIVMKSDVFKERQELVKKRKFDDDWFFNKFERY